MKQWVRQRALRLLLPLLCLLTEHLCFHCREGSVLCDYRLRKQTWVFLCHSEGEQRGQHTMFHGWTCCWRTTDTILTVNRENRNSELESTQAYEWLIHQTKGVFTLQELGTKFSSGFIDLLLQWPCLGTFQKYRNHGGRDLQAECSDWWSIQCFYSTLLPQYDHTPLWLNNSFTIFSFWAG